MRLEVRGLKFSYNNIPVLKDISMEAREGEILTIVGPNGTGKTTLLNCIMRILRPEAGQILIEGREIGRLNRRELAKQIGYVPQRETTVFPCTVFDAVLMGRRPYLNWRPSGEDYQIVSSVLHKLQLKELVLRDMCELSGGQIQKVMIARSIAQTPKVLLLDEPTSHLDLKHQLEVMNVIKDLVKERKISAVIAMHDLNLASKYSDRIIMLNQGETFASGKVKDVLTPDNIRVVYGVKVTVRNDLEKPFVVPGEPV